MGKLTAEQVVDLLTQAGIRCARGYPGGRMPAIQKPAVAVNPHREDAESVTMAVSVFSPIAQGASVCEDFAARVARLLRDSGGRCVQEECRHDGQADRFFLRILATWTEEPEACPYSVHLGGRLPCVVQFSARQELALEPVRAMGEDAAVGLLRKDNDWTFTLEERFPPDVPEPEAPAEPFDLVVRRGDLGEVYEGCRWFSVLREDTSGGLHQIRMGRAGTRSVISYE